MRFLNRKTECALNILQVMYVSRTEQPRWSAADLGKQLMESELWVYQIAKELKQHAYLYSVVGAGGGYLLFPGMEQRTLKEFLGHFNRFYGPNPLISQNCASEHVNQVLDHYFATPLEKVFNGVKANLVANFNQPDGVA